jgi:hypothetical protein
MFKDKIKNKINNEITSKNQENNGKWNYQLSNINIPSGLNFELWELHTYG